VVDRGASLTHPYVAAGICAAFAMAYGFLDLEPSPFMTLCLGLGPAVTVATWLAADTRRTGVALKAAHTPGWAFCLAWPLVLPWYAWRTRGRGGWRLVVRLYVVAIAALLGMLAGLSLRILVAIWMVRADLTP
jgi:hypothetical protein